MPELTRRFFIALLPPLEIQAEVKQIQQYFAQHYGSRHVLKSPPHITLQPPFLWEAAKLTTLNQCLQQFALQRQPITITLVGFNAFAPRVIYVDVLKTRELLDFQADLMGRCASDLGIVDPVSRTRPFTPHMTVAFRDLTRQNFKQAWLEFQQRQLHLEFTVTQLTLLVHDGQQWQISNEFPFATP